MPTHDDTSDAVKLLANLYVHHCTVVEWFDLLKRQIERAQKYAPDLAPELIAIRDAMRSLDHPHFDLTGRLGALALEAQSMEPQPLLKR